MIHYIQTSDEDILKADPAQSPPTKNVRMHNKLDSCIVEYLHRVRVMI